MNVVDQYAHDVVTGVIPAGKYHRLACLRHQRDRAREATPEFPYRFDLARAERLWRFTEKLAHYKGTWAGQLIRLEPWQKFILGSLVGWIHTGTGHRRFRTAFHEVPRKNGKSILAAVVLLYLTFFDGEAGAEGYSCATKREQAKIVFNDCKRLVLSSGLKSRLGVRVGNIHHEGTSSKLEPLGADHDSTDGLNPNAVVVDEMHAMKDRGMLDVMETATGARLQPVIYEITTFGDNPVSPWGDQHDYAMKLLEGVLVDETFYVFSAHADVDDPWDSLETAKKANPNYGVSVQPDDLAAKIVKAKGIPSAAATYKQKHLNLLTSSLVACLSVDGWRAGQSKGWTPALDVPDLRHEPTWVGIDLASKLDLCAVTFAFPPAPGRPKWRWLQQIWTPEATMADRAHRDRAPYPVWVEQGWLQTTPGTQIDHQVVIDALLAARELYDIQLIGFDPWHSSSLIQTLVTTHGFAEDQVMEVAQTFAGMSSACLKVQADILAGQIDAGGCPVTAWSVSNVVANRDGKDNLAFAKGKSRGRIDPVIAGTIAEALWLKQPMEAQPTYEVAIYGGRT